MASLLFKLEYIVRELWFEPGDEMTFDYGGPHQANVALRAPSDEDQSTGHDRANACCTASCAVEPSEKVRGVFAKIATNQMAATDEEEWTAGSASYLGPDGTRIFIPDLSRFPEHFRSFITNVRSELHDWADR
jgi:hypothetical protein